MTIDLFSFKFIFVILTIGLIILSGCDVPLSNMENNAQPLVVRDFFPPMAVGDTSRWEFTQEIAPGSLNRTKWTGITKWKVVSIDSTPHSHSTTIQRVFSGSWEKTTGPPPMSGLVHADTSYFSVTQSDSFNITLDLRAEGLSVSYKGSPVSFSRFYPDSLRDEVSLLPLSTVRVILRNKIGIIRYEMFRLGMIGTTVSYSRIE